MKESASNRTKCGGYTLTEVLIAVVIISLLSAVMLSFWLDVRERFHRWNIEMELDQEALRFFTYLENRNAGVRAWNVEGSSLTLEMGGRVPVKRRFYRLGDHIVETEVGAGGSLILCYHVQDVRFIPNGDSLRIRLTLTKGTRSKTYEGSLFRSLGP